jgi:site-specific DNA-cytosine methylase
MENNPKALSLFSGMGGDSVGMEAAGFDVIAFSEFDNPAINTHRVNFPKTGRIYNLYPTLYLNHMLVRLI